MIGLGVFAAFGAALLLFVTRGGRAPDRRWLGWLAIGLPFAAVFANSWGWIFTEMGRQPWVVFGLMTTERAVSPGVSVLEASISLIALTSLYAVLMVIEVKLLLTYVRLGAAPYVEPGPDSDDDSHDRPLAFAY